MEQEMIAIREMCLGAERYLSCYTLFMEGTVPVSDRLLEDAKSEESVTEALNRIYQDEDSSLDPVLASIQAASLPIGES